MNTPESFWARVDTSAGPDECHPWMGYTYKTGYGSLWFGDKRPIHAHVVAERLTNGEIPQGIVLHHLCENRACCNPRHLIRLTQAEHMAFHASQRTHCKKGHLITEENTYVDKKGWRSCRVCARERDRLRVRPRKGMRGDATVCRYGHAKEGDNLIVRPDGRRECKTCRQMWGRRQVEREKTKRRHTVIP